MHVDASDQAERILAEQRARRPRWYKSAAQPTPSWFSGGELDLLAADERDDLFREVSARNRPAWGVLLVLTAVNAPNVTGHILSNSQRTLWICVAVVWAALPVGAWLARRRRILVTARARVRERDDWPLLAK